MFRGCEFTFYRAAILLVVAGSLGTLKAQTAVPEALGIFNGQSDIGNVLHPGSGQYDPNAKTYTLTGSGSNMWLRSDEFHFVWTKVSGDDVALAADISLLGQGGNAHRKAVLMIRQSLESDAAYADAAIHGEGLAALQFRDLTGAPTHEIIARVSGPKRLRIAKRGNLFYLGVSGSDNQLQFAGGSAQVALKSPFYVGIGVCAHDKDNVQTATFSNVELATNSPASSNQSYSTIETLAVPSTDARAVYLTSMHIDSPTWSGDGSSILFNADGKPQQISATGENAQSFSDSLPDDFTQQRSPDGRYVYMSSNRGGTLKLWRTNPDGSNAVQLTHDALNSVSPRLSPDGKELAFLSYASNLMVLRDNTDLEVRVLSLADYSVKTVAKIVGGRNSLGAQPWSSDGKQLTFVSYQSFQP